MRIQAASYPTPPATFFEGLRYCHDPRLVRYHFRSLQDAVKSLIALSGASLGAVREAFLEIGEDHAFLKELAAQYQTVLARELQSADFMYLTRIDKRPPFRVVIEEAGGLLVHGPVQYALVRLLRPAVVVETGGTPGNSSAFILRALDRNGCGVLHTVDLPPEGRLDECSGQGVWIHSGLPEGKTSGWVIPDFLRGRHHQHLGDARTLLPGVLDSVGSVDLFIHDSDHSYDHMMYEFRMAWPYLRAGSVLLSDDINVNTAWRDFTSSVEAPNVYRAFSLGVARKPG